MTGCIGNSCGHLSNYSKKSVPFFVHVYGVILKLILLTFCLLCKNNNITISVDATIKENG